MLAGKDRERQGISLLGGMGLLAPFPGHRLAFAFHAPIFMLSPHSCVAGHDAGPAYGGGPSSMRLHNYEWSTLRSVGTLAGRSGRWRDAMKWPSVPPLFPSVTQRPEYATLRDSARQADWMLSDARTPRRSLPLVRARGWSQPSGRTP